jgi:hypothetical protein
MLSSRPFIAICISVERMASYQDERIFSRPTRTARRGHRVGHVSDLSSHTRTLPQTPPRNGRSDTTPAYRWATATHHARAARYLTGADCGCSRCDTGRNLSVVAAAHWRAGLAGHHEPRTCQDWLDTQKKTIAASERDEGRRCDFRLQILQHAASRFVIVDENGYNNNTTEIHGTQHHHIELWGFSVH